MDPRHEHVNEGNTRKKLPRASIVNKKVLAWSAWDWGSAAFNAVATTFVFSVYLTSGLFGDKDMASSALANGLTVAGIVIALLAPISGQRADRKGKGTFWLGVNTYLVVALMFLIYFVAPESPLGKTGALWLGIAILGLGNVFFEFASVNYNAMLGRISTPETMGRISGLGWGAGYVGGIVLLLFLYFGFINPEVGLFGVTSENGLDIRVAMLISAAWFGLSAIPVLVTIRGRKHKDANQDKHESIITSYKLLWRTVKRLAKEAPHSLFFLAASAVFRDGLAGVFTFGAILAAGVFGFSAGEVLIFGVAANVVAGIATIAFGALDDLLGPKTVIIFSLTCMVISGLCVFFFHNGLGSLSPHVVFWIFGLLLCIFVGPSQSASRSFLARVIPEGREGEVFGLYATTGRAVSFLAPLMFSVFLSIGKAIEGPEVSSQHWGILGIVLILLAGLLMMIPVKAEKAHLGSMK
ncbi:MFS transporter [Gleimia hominis]|uniref:MFS transporter n=1 Tax=Gleimia hominis TaxID=595468 RepID=UPI0011AF15AA|nr:MFS transporter [Gleimia hominis]WIK65440.1 MFS transporter [Gleimia hominis]